MADAQPLLYRAMRTAKRQQARSLEFRAAMDLAALWTDQGKRAEALDLLAPLHASFTEDGYARLARRKSAAGAAAIASLPHAPFVRLRFFSLIYDPDVPCRVLLAVCRLFVFFVGTVRRAIAPFLAILEVALDQSKFT